MGHKRARRRFLLPASIALAVMIIGIIYLKAIPAKFVHYLVWRLTATTRFTRGQVRVGDVDIHYVTCGRGPAVLLLHGGLSHRLSWFAQIPWLVDSGHRVVLPDTRGHGDSDLGHVELSYRLLAGDAVSILDQLSIERVDVVGWSDGGNTALLLARYWPQRVRRMVVISANFTPDGLTAEARRENHTPIRGVAGWLKRWWTGAGDRFRDLEARVKRMWQTRPDLKRADLEKIIAPTLVIVGETDVISIAHARQMAEWLANGSLAVVPGGHATPVTRARWINRLIGDFLFDPSLTAPKRKD